MNDIISTINLTKKYREVLAVDNVNLSIKKGEIFGFLGLNGAGKTTTIRMLLGMILPTSGQCYLKGEKVSSENRNIWNKVGYIVDTPYAYPELTVRENLEIIRMLRGIKEKECVDWIIEKLNLVDYSSRKSKHLSLGNAQRLGIAKALIHKPEILILDEPTNGLDPAGIVEVRDLLQDLARNYGSTILVSSHKLDEISRIATNIAIIHNGRLIKEIDTNELDSQLDKTLLIDGQDQNNIIRTLYEAGFQIEMQNVNCDPEQSIINLKELNAIQHPEKIAELLVIAGYPPFLLKVEKEDLETYFLRTIQELGGI